MQPRTRRLPPLLPDRAAARAAHLLGLRTRRHRLRRLPAAAGDRHGQRGAAARPAPLPRRRGGAAAGAREPGAHRRRRSRASSASWSRTSRSSATRRWRCARRRSARRCPTCSTARELARLLAATERDDVWERHFPGKRERDRLLLALFAYAGLRRSELLGLDWDDVDLDRRLLRVRKAKGGRQRVVPIHPALEPLFVDYLAIRAAAPEPALFVGVQGKRLSLDAAGQTFLRYVGAAGVSERKRVTPHTLRHVFASELLRAGANLRQIQELLGHKHLDSTQRYTRVTAHELRGAVKRLRWVGAR